MNKYEKMNEARLVQDFKKRVVAYCRVSTDNEDQTNSYESQQRFFKEYIERTPGWELVEVFADKGLSGTSTAKRKAFNQMIDRARGGDFDLIITKEISRFARNTLDSIQFTRELKKYGVGVLFMNDGINTLDGDAELRLSILASIAQEESRRTSERVKWGQKRRMEAGIVFGNSMLGYDVKGGVISINEEGAKIVRLIFHMFVNERKGVHTIANELREEGYRTVRGNPHWTNTQITRVIRNEKYCGDLVQKKTITPDFLTQAKKKNEGEEEFVIIKNHHEPIISRKLFNEANKIIDENSSEPKDKSKYTKRYPFSGKLVCGICGKNYASRPRKRANGTTYNTWKCVDNLVYGKPRVDRAGNKLGCAAPTIRNDEAMLIMNKVVKTLQIESESFVRNVVQTVQAVIAAGSEASDAEKLLLRVEDAKSRKKRLIELYMDNGISREDFASARDKVDGEIEELQKLMDSIDHRGIIIELQQALINDITSTVNSILSGDVESGAFYRELLDKMVVRGKNDIEVYLKLLPLKWRYAMKGALKLADYPNLQNDAETSIVPDATLSKCDYTGIVIPGRANIVSEVEANILCQISLTLNRVYTVMPPLGRLWTRL